MNEKLKAFATASRRRMIMLCLSALFVAVAAASVIINFVAARSLGWSLLVLGALVFAWPPLFFLVCKKKNKLYWAIGSMCALAIPLMLWIDRQGVAQGAIRLLGIPVAACCIAYVLFLLVLFKWLHRYVWSLKMALAVALLIPLTVAIQIFYAAYTGIPFPLLQVLAGSLVLLCIALVFFVPSFIRKDRMLRKRTHIVKQAEGGGPTPPAPL